ncbi:MAG: FecR domain-containing protein, partial [Magnetovibrio sp.]|nr:FecR domain-containing protein [Magnetovibrio sp.]
MKQGTEGTSSGDTVGTGDVRDQAFSVVYDAAVADAMVVGDGAWLLQARFVREGPDLILIGADGAQVLVQGYFQLETPPNLVTPAGAKLSPQFVDSLLAPVVDSSVTAQMMGLSTSDVGSVTAPIGQIDAIEGKVEVIRVDGSRVTVAEGDQIFQGDEIVTDADGSIGITFEDNSTFSLGPDGRMVISEMVYDPIEQTGAMRAEMVQGVFSFISGDIAKTDPDAMVLNTPVGTIGIRGTKIAGRIAQDGEQSTISLLQELDAEGNPIAGEITITNEGGVVTLNQPGQTVQMTSAFAAPSAPQIWSQDQIDNTFGPALNFLPIPPAPPASDGNQSQDALTKALQGLEDAQNAGQLQAAEHRVDLANAQLEIQKFLLPEFVKVGGDAPISIPDPGPDYGILLAPLTPITSNALAAAQSAGAVEVLAASKLSSTANTITTLATAQSVGLSTVQAQELASVMTAPMKALGAAGALSASASAFSKVVLAAAAEAAKGHAVDAAIIAYLEDTVAQLTTSAAKMATIVNAAIKATDLTWTTTLSVAKAAKAAGGNATSILAAAKTEVINKYSANIATELTGTGIAYTDIDTIANDVKLKMNTLDVAVQAGNGSASMATAMTHAKSASTFAFDTATRAKETIGAADEATMLAKASLAFSSAELTKKAQADADAAVNLSVIGVGLDVSALAKFNNLIKLDQSAETSSVAATSGIGDAVAASRAAQEYLDGTAQAKLDTAKAGTVTAKATATTKEGLATDAASALLNARAVLAEKVVDKAIAEAKNTAYQNAATAATAAKAAAHTDTVSAQGQLKAIVANSVAKTAYDFAVKTVAEGGLGLSLALNLTADTLITALKGATSTNETILATAKLQAQLVANAQATAAFKVQIEALYNGAAIKATSNADKALLEYSGTDGTGGTVGEAATAQSDVDTLSTAADTAIENYLSATVTLSDAEASSAAASGYMKVAQAGAEAQYEATLTVEVEQVQSGMALVKAAAVEAAHQADIAKAQAQLGQAPNKHLAQEAEDAAYEAWQSAVDQFNAIYQKSRTGAGVNDDNTIKVETVTAGARGGDASAKLTLSGNVEAGDVYTVTLGGHAVGANASYTVSYTVQAGDVVGGDAAASLANVRAALVSAINADLAATTLVDASAGPANGEIILASDPTEVAKWKNDYGETDYAFSVRAEATNKEGTLVSGKFEGSYQDVLNRTTNSTADTDRVVLINSDVATGDVVGVKINGTTVNYTVQAGQTLSQIRDSVAAAINANATIKGTVNAASGNDAGKVNISPDVAGTKFTASVTDVTKATVTLVDAVDFAASDAASVAARGAQVDAALAAKDLAAQYVTAAEASYNLAKSASAYADAINPRPVSEAQTKSLQSKFGASQSKSDDTNNQASQKSKQEEASRKAAQDKADSKDAANKLAESQANKLATDAETKLVEANVAKGLASSAEAAAKAAKAAALAAE